MTPCLCGCGTLITTHRRAGDVVRFVTGHNQRGKALSVEHRRKIGRGQRRAWRRGRVDSRPIGATAVNHHGYIEVKLSNGVWRKQHVLVVERRLGRRLKPTEEVHHVNGIRRDNKTSNLVHCKHKGAHSKMHASFMKLLPQLFANGSVRFNRRLKVYEAVER